MAGWVLTAEAQRGAPPPTPPKPAGVPTNPGGQGTANGTGRRGANPNPNPNPNAPAQTGRATFRASVELVEVDVSVLDKDRQPVRGLTPADFTVLEEHQPQAIAAFSEVDVPQPVEPPAVWMREVSPDVKSNSANDRRLFALVMDDAMTQPDPRTTAKMKEIGHIIVDRLGPSDLATVIFTLNDRVSQDFTNDRARLLATVDKFSPGFGGGELFDRYPLNTIQHVAEFMADVPMQRKALVYVSPGIPMDLTGAAQMHVFGDATGHSSALASQMQQIFRAAAQANVSVYAIDPTGLNAALSATSLQAQMLRSLSDSTGGFAVVDQNEFNWGVSQIFTENSSYYLLGYQPAAGAGNGDFRKLEVKVNRPGVTVRSRSGYYPPKAGDARAVPTASPLTKAIAGLVPVGDMQMRVNVAPFAIPGKDEVALAIVLGLKQPASKRAEKVTEVVNLSVNAFDAKGTAKGVRRENANLVLKPGPDDEVQYEVLTRMDLKPGAYELRLAAFSGSLNRAGSIYVNVDLPDFSKSPISLSGVLLNASPALPLGAANAFAAIAPVVPTTQREFSGHSGTAFMRVYQGKSGPLQPVQLKVRFIDSNDEVVLEHADTLGPEKFGADRAADYRFDVPLLKLKPGAYDLSFDALLPNVKTPPAHRDVQIFVR